MTLEDVRDAGMSALFDALGPANALRFLQLFQPGSGDYTQDRNAWLDGLTLDEIMADVRRLQDGGLTGGLVSNDNGNTP
jgi:hypothetical protein